MDKHPSKRRGPIGVLQENRRLRWSAVAIAMAMGLYWFSFGPALWATRNGWLSKDQLQTLYRPVQIIYDNSPAPIPDAIDWYGELW